jgi:hypothetical protein
MMSKWSILFTSLLLSAQVAWSQMPTNSDKKFEYNAAASVKKAGTGDLVKRFEHWAHSYFDEAKSVEILVDDSTNRVVEIKVTEDMVESHFGVNRVHKNRSLTYHIKFDAERKNYTYWINGFYYKATEIDHKGRETAHDAALEDIKSAASKSLEEEIHAKIESMIDSFTRAAEIDLED